MKKLKVMTILGTRPEIIRLSEVIKALDKYFDHKLTHTGQNYDFELNEIFFKDLELRAPDHYLNSAGKNLGETIGNIISKSYDLLLKVKPDALLILGDTNSALSAISAKRLKIPIFHMEAGNRCFDQNVPEEINRKIVDYLITYNSFRPHKNLGYKTPLQVYCNYWNNSTKVHTMLWTHSIKWFTLTLGCKYPKIRRL